MTREDRAVGWEFKDGPTIMDIVTSFFAGALSPRATDLSCFRDDLLSHQDLHLTQITRGTEVGADVVMQAVTRDREHCYRIQYSARDRSGRALRMGKSLLIGGANWMKPDGNVTGSPSEWDLARALLSGHNGTEPMLRFSFDRMPGFQLNPRNVGMTISSIAWAGKELEICAHIPNTDSLHGIRCDPRTGKGTFCIYDL